MNLAYFEKQKRKQDSDIFIGVDDQSQNKDLEVSKKDEAKLVNHSK